ncbi:Arylacetamide deacetylase-like 3 [Merluccius polli]|uniref:Arylacetamide deacetylase-like 3 n=1 Tax=Merluccius polli TaxID=89951 RepID=A0AA47M851_MERPO|nr:Arylacetamide deacetylase-like 3 [Merluccius polli]
MDIGWAILIIGFAAIFAALLLLVNGIIYSEMMNSEIPRGLGNRGKLHAVHGLLVGVAVVGRVLERLGLCHQVSFTRWCRSCFLTRTNPVPPGLRVKDRDFSGVPVRIYEPTSTTSALKGLRRGLVYFHGGGWVMGSIDSADEVCRYLAKESGTTVVSVGYRLAPEHRYPTQLDDCQAATCHFLSVAEAEFGVDPGRVAVGGDSTGGNLAAALCLRLAAAAAETENDGKEQEEGRPALPCAQLLLCPALQMADFSTPSYQQNQAVPPLFRGRAAFYFLQYLCGDATLCPDVLDGVHVPPELWPRYRDWLSSSNLPQECLARGYRRHPATAEYDAEVYHAIKEGLRGEVSPLLADEAILRKSPPTFLLTCEYDVLRDDGLLYRKRLLDLGVEVAWQHVGDGFHGVLNYINQGWLSFPAATRALDWVVDFVKTL